VASAKGGVLVPGKLALDIEEFLELRKNTGDDRRRTHDMNTANWIPDLFMKRVMEAGSGRCSRPADVPDLHDKVGKDSRSLYEYERNPDHELRASQAHPGFDAVAQDADHRCSRPGIPGSLQGSLQHPQPQSHVGMVHSSTFAPNHAQHFG